MDGHALLPGGWVGDLTTAFEIRKTCENITKIFKTLQLQIHYIFKKTNATMQAARIFVFLLQVQTFTKFGQRTLSRP
jgi:hypothetical protein